MGVPRPYRRSRIYPLDRAGAVHGRPTWSTANPTYSPASSAASVDRPCEPRLRGAVGVEDKNRSPFLSLETCRRRSSRRRATVSSRKRRPRRMASASPASAPGRHRSPWPTISCRWVTKSRSSRSGTHPAASMRTNIPSFRLPEQVLRRGDRLHHRFGGVDLRLELTGDEHETTARHR